MAVNIVQLAVRIPSWCEWGRGDGPIVLVAPHGGRRPQVDPRSPPTRLRVNDLYTPEITRTLAARLRAGYIINIGQDRNVLDLNRLSQVHRRALWFLELLTQELAAVIERHGHVELVVVHGWNIGQAKCDIGIGVVETENGLHPPDGARFTVSQAYLRARIVALRAACARAGIAAPIGERYAASHPNNLLQLFTVSDRQGYAPPCVRQIGAWVTERRVNALQLELGIPLRWPGIWRDTFIDAVVEAFGGRGENSRAESRGMGEQTSRSTTRQGHLTGVPLPLNVPRFCRDDSVGRPARNAGYGVVDATARLQHVTLRTRGAALQFYDPAVDVGMFAGVGPLGRVVGGRLLLFVGGQRLALFTGEAADPHGWAVHPLEFHCEDEATHVDFAGPVLAFDDAATCLDLEAALAAARLVEAQVHLRFRARHCTSLPRLSREGGDEGVTAARFGMVHGGVTIGGREFPIGAGAFADAGGLRAMALCQQTMIAADFGARAGVLSRAVEGDAVSVALHFAAGTLQYLDGARIIVTTDGDAYTPGLLEFVCDGQPRLHGRPLSRMAILRPAGLRQSLRVTFGAARFRWGDQDGYGLYEHARPVPCA